MKARKSANWMQQVDERILEHLSEEGWASPRTMVSDSRFGKLKVSRAHVRERCEELTRRELVVPIYSDMYEITSEGLAYLRGDLDAGHLRRWPQRKN
jgi:Mn-dependent DtxR family transcriptional regulator